MATPWGAYEGVVKPDLDAGSGLRGGKSKTFSPTLGQQSAEQTRRESVTQPVTLD